MTDSKNWSKFINKLTADTFSGGVKWKVLGTPRMRQVGAVYFAEVVSGKHVAVYRYTHDYYIDEDDFRVVEDVAVELCDQMGDKLWALPKLHVAKALIDAIEFKAAKADDFFDEFMKD